MINVCSIFRYIRCLSSGNLIFALCTLQIGSYLSIFSRTFAEVSIILFLNKMDLLEDKVQRKKVDISQFFQELWNETDEVRRHVPKFNGDPLDVNDVKNFILYLFVAKQKFIHSQRPIYHHFTTAVNTKNIQYVFTSVKETILRKNLSALMLQWREIIRIFIKFLWSLPFLLSYYPIFPNSKFFENKTNQ